MKNPVLVLYEGRDAVLLVDVDVPLVVEVLDVGLLVVVVLVPAVVVVGLLVVAVLVVGLLVVEPLVVEVLVVGLVVVVPLVVEVLGVSYERAFFPRKTLQFKPVGQLSEYCMTPLASRQ